MCFYLIKKIVYFSLALAYQFSLFDIVSMHAAEYDDEHDALICLFHMLAVCQLSGSECTVSNANLLHDDIAQIFKNNRLVG